MSCTYRRGDNSDDCDDENADISPNAFEICDDIDNNCDDVVDTDARDRLLQFVDNDGDGYGTFQVYAGLRNIRWLFKLEETAMILLSNKHPMQRSLWWCR